MASVQDQDVLRNMILTFRVTDLQMLLGFAGRNKNGKKHELQARALALVKIRSTPMQAKIRELYKASQESQAAAMMGQGGQPINPYPGVNYAALMGAYGVQQAAGIQGNPYAAAYAGRAGAQAHQFQQQIPAQPGAQAHGNVYNGYQVAPTRTVPVHPDVKLIKLPFYDISAELLKPASLVAQGGNRFHESQFQFFLTPAQATDIASNRDIQVGTRMDYLYQIQLRFCPLSLEPNKEMSDEFPPSVNVHVNGKMVQLPNPIPTNKPGVEPKRPPKPVNITPHCKLSPILPNTVGVKWAAEYGKGWTVAIFLVVKLTSDDLLDRLKKKGTREPDYTRNLIIQKLNNDDDDVATTSLKVSVTCPLGKMRMKVPCRPSTCGHLQCFDGSTFLQMNERKPTWNCPVCNQKALYDDLLIDGYYQDILDSKKTIDEETIILEKDGTWKPVPKEDKDGDKDKVNGKSSSPSQNNTPVKGGEPGKDIVAASNGTSTNAKSIDTVDCIDLSDDEEIPLPPSSRPPPLPTSAPPLPPPPPPPLGEIECIDLD